MSFNRFTYEIKIHSIDSHYVNMLLADATEEEANKAARTLLDLVPNYYRIEIVNKKNGTTINHYNQKNTNLAKWGK